MINFAWWELLLFAITVLSVGFATGLAIGTNYDDYMKGYKEGVEDAKSIVERFEQNNYKRSDFS